MPANQARELPAQHHVWTPDQEGVQSAPFDRFGNAFLRDLRWREPPRERRRLGFAVAIAILLHVALVVLLRLEMRPQYVPHGQLQQTIDVTLLETPAAVESAPVPELNLPPPPRAAARPRVHVEPRAPDSMSATLEAKPAPRLYGHEGQLLVPPDELGGNASTGVPAYQTPQLQEPALMTHTTPLPYQSTRFDKDWAPSNESLGAKAFRKAVDATTAEKTITLPGNIKIKCAVSPLLLAFGCGPRGPDKPSPKSRDPRLSLPPTQSLTGEKVPQPVAPTDPSQLAKPANAASQGEPPASAAPPMPASPASANSAAHPASAQSG